MATRDRSKKPGRERVEAGTEVTAAVQQPEPQPERAEPTLHDPAVTDLSRADWIAIFKRAAKEMLDDNMMMIASALAYSSFFAMPSALLVALGLFTLFASPA